MPNYLYRCECGYQTDWAHSIDAEPELFCPECKELMSRVPQITTIQFKGQGWGHQ